MRKRDRTNEERKIDAKIATGIMRLGTNPKTFDDPTSFRHVCRTDDFGRKGHKCQILESRGFTAKIRFEDGYTAVVSRQNIRRSD
jgi:hypothetical protein